LQLLDTSQRGDHTLDGARAIACVLDDLQVAALTGGLDAEEHAAPNRDTAILARSFSEKPRQFRRHKRQTWHHKSAKNQASSTITD